MVNHDFKNDASSTRPSDIVLANFRRLNLGKLLALFIFQIFARAQESKLTNLVKLEGNAKIDNYTVYYR